jgi:lipopolysaccharide export LptBFGC system permease protein LptF
MTADRRSEYRLRQAVAIRPEAGAQLAPVELFRGEERRSAVARIVLTLVTMALAIAAVCVSLTTHNDAAALFVRIAVGVVLVMMATLAWTSRKARG